MKSDPPSAEQEFDFIVVGSGAGGGPLAARLVEAGHRVLVLEAGSDDSDKPKDDPVREVTEVPGFHGVSTEDPDLSWEFFVKHYENPPGIDPKWDEEKGGIFYPRAAALGGCTIHNAMITIAGPDRDWDELADFLRDPSWRGSEMRRYFEKFERNQYVRRKERPPGRFERALHYLRWLFWSPPDYIGGRHGFDGWLRTSLTDISLGLRDKSLVKMLKAALWEAKRQGMERAWTLVRTFLKGNISQALDPNHARTLEESPEGLTLVPLAVYGAKSDQAGKRSGPRELLLETRSKYPDRLEIRTDCLVTRVVFDKRVKKRAVGVEYLEGAKLYRAHPEPRPATGEPKEARVRPGGEVILCGGAFNTPQLLMLSGIGDREHLKDRGIECRVERPGVGKNLQDRYEVTLISEMDRDFSLLDGATFELPNGPNAPDEHLRQWRATGTGLYTSNGAVLGIFKRSRKELEQPDLFIFGIPLPFHGYERGYSKVGDKHNYFTWAILKGATRNYGGTVRLVDAEPLNRPEINFRYFNELSARGGGADDPDLKAMVEGVKFVRGIAKHAKFVRGEHHHPGLSEIPTEDDESIARWVQRVAWGHHACGTCRMGPEGDEDAVLDSRFRVRGVEGLRVVDASIFPKIPGFFIVANIYMASEKAAEIIDRDIRGASRGRAEYPNELRDEEAGAIKQRRELAGVGEAEDVIGLGLSGGGIRSATFNLGVLQAMAKGGFLRRIDLLSTVSGGGYIGAFLGRFFDRLRASDVEGEPQADPSTAQDRVAEELTSPQSREIGWLRRHGNYLAPAGHDDMRTNIATFLRNFLSVHFVVGLLLFALFGLSAAVRYGLLDNTTTLLRLGGFDFADLPINYVLSAVLGPFWNPWYVVFELLVLVLAFPQMVGYWLSSQDEHGRFQPPALLLVLILIAGALWLGLAGAMLPMLFVAASLALGFIQVELAWQRGKNSEAATGTGGEEIRRLRTRNFLTYDLGLSLALCGAVLGFAFIDSLAHAIQQAVLEGNTTYVKAFAAILAALAALAPIARFAANFLAREDTSARKPSAMRRIFKEQIVAGLLALVLLLVPLVFYAFAAHAAYLGGAALSAGLLATVGAILVSLAVFTQEKTRAFVNRASLSQTYTARLARAYLGASNPLRHRPVGRDITEVMAGDDAASMRDYRPHEAGGPLHLVNVTVNQTIDFTSQRGNRDRLGENVAVSCLGMSIGLRWHSFWRDAEVNGTPLPGKVGIAPIGDLVYHPLKGCVDGKPRNAEALSLRRWIAVSGAAAGPGQGQATALGTALLFGLANLRTGYWWDSGVTEIQRDGFPKLTFLRRALYVFQHLFLTQHLLLSEWVARFPGPWGKFWNISDGGFFECLGGYELIRRRVPRIVLSDASADPEYRFDCFAGLVRKARIDFGARIEPFTDAECKKWGRGLVGSMADLEPERDEAGGIIGPSKAHASLFWVHYPPSESGDVPAKSVLLYVKATVTGDEEADVEQYHARRGTFPHESTGDQFFDEAQWESYRKLGEHLATPLFSDLDWLKRIPRE